MSENDLAVWLVQGYSITFHIQVRHFPWKWCWCQSLSINGLVLWTLICLKVICMNGWTSRSDSPNRDNGTQSLHHRQVASPSSGTPCLRLSHFDKPNKNNILLWHYFYKPLQLYTYINAYPIFDTTDRTERTDRTDRTDRIFQITCVGQLSQFLQCLLIDSLSF